MKIKKFESFINPEGNNTIYYTLHIDGSWDKFLIALDKLGLREQFLNDWEIEDMSDLSDINAEYLKNDTIVFLIRNDEFFYIRNTIDEYYEKKYPGKIILGLSSIMKHEKVINGGDIYVEDWEVTSNKYNL